MQVPGGAEAPGWKLQEWRHRERTSASTATAEQVQEALQQLEAQGARIAALETAANRISPRSESRAREKHADSDFGYDAEQRLRKQHEQRQVLELRKVSGHYWRDCKERRSARERVSGSTC